MKKIFSLLVVLVLLISISSIVYADEAEEDSPENDTVNETEKEIEVMNNSLGSEIRLLQLEKALLINILKGEMAVQVLIGLGFNTTENNTIELESILDEMKDVLEEIKTANTSSNESVQIFISLKNESKNLTTQFRETIRELLNDTSLREVRERIKEMANNQLNNYSKKIRNLIRQFNFNQLYRLYGIIGEANSSFVNDYFNGTLPLNETKLQLLKVINEMTKEKKYEIFSEIKGENIRRKIQAQNEIKNMDKGKGNGKN
ncbi:MAG: hypothetical protein BV456_02630 [Thermoplasmata archaeon M8B2D]|nr:MAG: hypothetical protein BV456_02630 [Thermoplasmata archaeon M8B2D]